MYTEGGNGARLLCKRDDSGRNWNCCAESEFYVFKFRKENRYSSHILHQKLQCVCTLVSRHYLLTLNAYNACAYLVSFANPG